MEYKKKIDEYLQLQGHKALQLRAVLFDMDGVLFDSMPYHAEAWSQVMTDAGYNFSKEDVYMNEGRTGADTINTASIAQFGHPSTPEQIEASHPEAFEQIAELEHMRWARYHFLNNWRQGEPVNGESKNKNVTMRVHRLLVPYSKLDEKDREMDRRNIRILLDVFNKKRRK